LVDLIETLPDVIELDEDRRWCAGRAYGAGDKGEKGIDSGPRWVEDVRPPPAGSGMESRPFCAVDKVAALAVFDPFNSVVVKPARASAACTKSSNTLNFCPTE
jgi:hypothetical protein